MSSTLGKLGARVLSLHPDDWNHRRRMLALVPLWSILGYPIGFFGGVHWVPPVVPDPVVSVSFAVFAIVIGMAVLVLVD